MRLRDCFGYLVGGKAAILAIARTRGALLLGAVLVLTGSVARNYDGKDLIGEWDALLHGIGVSFVNALIVWTMVYVAALARKVQRPAFFRGFLSFLGLFWMTAPMAWLYAIPYEQFMSPVDAIHANAWTLALVSVWRVVLIARALSVIWGAPYWTIFCIVIFFADVAVLIGVQLAPGPLIDFMGGLQHTPEELALAGLRTATWVWSMLGAIPTFIAALLGYANFEGRWSVEGATEGVAPRVWLLPAAALVALAPAAWLMQPQQRLRHRVETMLTGGQVEEGMREMSRHERGVFPRVWDPPPQTRTFPPMPPMDDVRAALAKGGQAAWVRDLFLRKSWAELSQRTNLAPDASVAEVADRLDMRDAMDDDAKAVAVRFHLEHDERMTDADREALERIMPKASKMPD